MTLLQQVSAELARFQVKPMERGELRSAAVLVPLFCVMVNLGCCSPGVPSS